MQTAQSVTKALVESNIGSLVMFPLGVHWYENASYDTLEGRVCLLVSVIDMPKNGIALSPAVKKGEWSSGYCNAQFLIDTRVLTVSVNKKSVVFLSNFND